LEPEGSMTTTASIPPGLIAPGFQLPQLGSLADCRQVGTSLWSLAASLMAEPIDVVSKLLVYVEMQAMRMLASSLSGHSRLSANEISTAMRELQCVRALACEIKERPWATRQYAPSAPTMPEQARQQPPPTSEGGVSGSEQGSEAAQRLATDLAVISERCARTLLRFQVTSMLSAVATIANDDAETASRALPAADWLMAEYVSERDEAASTSAAGDVEDDQHGLPRLPDVSSMEIMLLDQCYTLACCSQGKAAVQAAEDGSCAPPTRARCLLCKLPVPVVTERTTQLCEGNHALQRCWICLEVLPLRSWCCATCGAGCCPSHDGLPAMGVLHKLSPLGVCGLCGSPTKPPESVLLC
jgi:hypothetical protein